MFMTIQLARNLETKKPSLERWSASGRADNNQRRDDLDPGKSDYKG